MKRLHLLTLLLAGLTPSLASAAPDAITLRVAPERDLIYAQGSREVMLQIELEGKRPERNSRAPINLALVLDRSGSMRGAKIEKAKQAACTALDQLDSQDFVSLVVYDDHCESLIPPQRITSKSERQELKRRIEAIEPGGGTAIYAGVQQGAKLLRRHLDQEHLNRIVLLSDGIANVGPSRVSDLAEIGGQLRKEGLSVTTIGLGDDYNEDLMSALAEASHANYYYVQDSEKLPGIFSEELGAARSVLARNITVKITVPKGVMIREILGHPEISCHNQSAEITLPEYFGTDKRRFLARCVVESARETALEVAAVTLGYEDITGTKVATQGQTALVKFTGEPQQSEQSVRSEVAREVAVWENRASKELAIKLADEGNAKDAAEVLRNRAIANANAPAASQIPNLIEENRKLEATASEVGSKGQLSKTSRKQVQYENWQDKYQKR